MAKKIKRYHRDIIFPDNFDEIFKEFHETIYATGPLVFSMHSVTRLFEYSDKHGKLFLDGVFDILRAGALEKEKLFELYTGKDGLIQKACFRYALGFAPLDVVLVISRTCVIITVMAVDRENKKETIDRRLYVKKEKK